MFGLKSGLHLAGSEVLGLEKQLVLIGRVGLLFSVEFFGLLDVGDGIFQGVAVVLLLRGLVAWDLIESVLLEVASGIIMRQFLIHLNFNNK